MKIVVVGLGYVGITAAGCLSSEGHEVVGVDINQTKIESILSGRSPIKEPGIDELISKSVDTGLLRAQSSIPTLDDSYQLVMVCVGTPSSPDGSHNMTYVGQATRQIAEAVSTSRKTKLTVAYRSTFRPGTIKDMITPMYEGLHGSDWRRKVELVYNPEFLRETSAIADFFHPPKVVVGTEDGCPSKTMEQLHANIVAPKFNVKYPEAEITKFVDNTWHATKVVFANEIGRLAVEMNLSAETVSALFLADTKLNISSKYLKPGAPFGGSCLPKDVRALEYLARVKNVDMPTLTSIMQSNSIHKKFQFNRAVEGLDKSSSILLVGLAFKTGTDDLRESPHIDLAISLLEAGYAVHIYDESLQPEKLIGQNLGYVYSHLPRLDSLLIEKSNINSVDFDRIIECTPGAADALSFKDQAMKLHRIR